MQKTYRMFGMMMFVIGTLCIANITNATGAEQETEATLIVPHLDFEIPTGQNVVWCSTLQLAWNELMALADGPIRMEAEAPLVDVLNQQSTTTADLDPASYVVAAGIVGQGELAEPAQELKELQDTEALPEGTLMAYASLSKALPFEWAFTRYTQPLTFGDQQVSSFGLPQYMPTEPTDTKAGEQVSILDYVSDDEFVLELHTQSAGDRLILAQVPPVSTLAATVQQVLDRISGSERGTLQELETLVVPVIDFDKARTYPELCGQPLVVENEQVNGKEFSLVTQRIQFSLDETGATLDSKALFVSSPSPRQFIFDAPFLVMLMQEGAASPYLAVWVANADLLVPFTQ